MAVINVATKEIHAKVVYYGPGFSGKTTNLEYIYRRVPKESKGEMLSLATETERTKTAAAYAPSGHTASTNSFQKAWLDLSHR